MPQNPIPAQAYSRGPTSATLQVRSGATGSVFAAGVRPGNDWFVNETTGSDSNPGTPQSPFATLDAALAAATANNGDTVWLNGSSHRSTTLNWNKNGVDLRAMQSPSNNGRSRISVKSGLTQTQVTALFPLVNVTAVGCRFEGIGTFYGFDGVLTPPAGSVAWAEAGGRNYYKNVQLLGGGDVLMAALAGMRSVTVGGQGENLFEDCTFGLDTVVRATNANATMEFIGGTTRNIFRRSIFQAYVTDASDCHILEAASGSDRYNYFFDTILANAVDSGATAMSAAVLWNGGGSPAGGLIFVGGISVGATAVATTGPVYSNLSQANAAGMVGVKLT